MQIETNCGYMFWIDSKDNPRFLKSAPDSPKYNPEYRAFLYVQIDSFGEGQECCAAIYNVYTRPEFRRQKYMTRLFSYMESLLKEVPGLRVIELISSDEGLKFYPTIGYVRRSYYWFIKIIK